LIIQLLPKVQEQSPVGRALSPDNFCNDTIENAADLAREHIKSVETDYPANNTID